jgi:FkbM family methyltransferase
VYRSADVLSNTSYGEGFGIPIVEAQACGTPVIVTDATAMPELCGSGWRVGYERLWHDSQGAFAAIPRIGDITDAYFQAYEKARDESMRAEAYAFAQDYDADRTVDKYWRPILGTLGGLLERRKEELAAKATSPRRRPPEKIREADGLAWIDRGSATGDSLGWKDHEGKLRPILENLLPWDGVLLDVGAHVGHWSLRLAERASRVIAVEANPATAKTLRRHIAMNGLTNVTVVELAAWDEQTMLKLDDPSGQVEGGSMRVLPPTITGEYELVPAGRLDEQLELTALGRLDVVKLDVEGADLHALRGMKGLLEKYQPVLFIECHDIYGYYTRADLEATLTGLGYEFEVVASTPTQWMPGGYSETVQQGDYLVARPVT